MAPFDRSHTSFYSSSVVTIAVSCAIKRDIGRKRPFSYPLVFNLHDPLECLRIFAQNFNTNCLSPWAVKRCKILLKSSSLCLQTTVQQRYRLTTDRRQTDRRFEVITENNFHRNKNNVVASFICQNYAVDSWRDCWRCTVGLTVRRAGARAFS